MLTMRRQGAQLGNPALTLPPVMSQYPPSAPIGLPSISIADILRGVARRKSFILLLALAGFALSFFYVYTAKPKYSSEAMVLIENMATPFDKSLAALNQNDQAPLDERVVLSQLSVINSRDLSGRVIQTLKLAERPEFDSLSGGIGMLRELLITLGFKPDPRLQTREQRAMAHFEDNVTAFQVPLSNVIAIRYTSTDSATAADVANALAETYVTSTREAQSGPTGRSREWLGQQIETLRKKVAESEAAAEKYRSEAGLLKGMTATLGTQQLSELNTQIILAETQRTEAEARARAIRDLLANKGSVDASSDVLNSTLIQRLREQQVAVARSLAELSVTYLPSHPKIIAAQKQIIDIDRQIRKEALRIVDGLEGQAKVAASREKSLRDSLAAMEKNASQSNLDEVKLRALEREATANREILEALLNRYSDASARQELDAQPGMARIIQRAIAPPVPSFPKTGPTVLLASAASLILGLGLAFLLEVMNAASRLGLPTPAPVAVPAAAPPAPAPVATRPEPVVAPAPPPPPPPPPPHEDATARALANSLAAAARTSPPAAEVPPLPPAMPRQQPASELTPSLCELPHSPDINASMSHALQVASNAGGAYAIAARQISSWVMSGRQTLAVKRLATLSLEDAQLDTSAITAAVARLQSQQGATAIVVNAWPGPSPLDAVFGTTAGPGLAELLSGHATFADIIARDALTGAHYLRGGLDRTAAQNYLASERTDMVLEALESAYDIVLLHAGCGAGLPAVLARKCQGALVLSYGAYPAETARMLQELRHAGLRAVQHVRVTGGRPMQAVREPQVA
jgi:uncharacterized protein involved in exopolysaccharide biosynthesis/Mrp family chromosome partitioning ATPase